MDTEWNLYKTLVYHREESFLARAEIAAARGEISKPLLALVYAAFGKIFQAEEILSSVENSDNEDLFEIEAKMLLVNSLRKRSEAIALASKAISRFPNAAFARYFLALDSIRSKRLQEALEHCYIFLQYYPEHDNVILLTSEVLAYLKRYKDSLEYAKRCRPSFKQKLHMVLIPIVLPRYRAPLVLLGMLGGALLPLWILIVVLVILLFGVITSLLKWNGTLIPSRLLYVVLMLVVSWWLGHWIGYLQNGL